MLNGSEQDKWKSLKAEQVFLLIFEHIQQKSFLGNSILATPDKRRHVVRTLCTQPRSIGVYSDQ